MPRPRQFETDDVLDAVMDVFWRNGYTATSTQDMVEATGLTRSSLYNAFSDKRSLYELALLQYNKLTAKNIELLERHAAALPAIRELLMSIVNGGLSDPARRGCFATNAAIELAGQDAKIGDLVQGNFATFEKALQATIRRGQEAGEITTRHDSRALARSVLNTIQGLRVLGKATPPEQRKRLIDVVEVTLAALAS